MNETQLALAIDGVRIPAILTAPPHPLAALLLIPGSFNSDVDGNYAPMFPGQPPATPHAYQDLARQLAAQGVAVLRFAKTGPGTGAVVIDKVESAEKYATFLQRVRVAELFLDHLHGLIAGVPAFVAGHSEGAVVAILLARKQNDLHGIITLSGPAQPLLHMMMRQQLDTEKKAGKYTPQLQRQYAEALALLDDFVASRPLPAGYETNPFAGAFSFMARPENASYLRSLESIDPAAEFARLTLPALIVQGGRDASIAPENAAILQRARPTAKIDLFPELQHFYKKVPAGLSPQESFAQSSESDPAVAHAIASWINGISSGKQR